MRPSSSDRQRPVVERSTGRRLRVAGRGRAPRRAGEAVRVTSVQRGHVRVAVPARGAAPSSCTPRRSRRGSRAAPWSSQRVSEFSGPQFARVGVDGVCDLERSRGSTGCGCRSPCPRDRQRRVRRSRSASAPSRTRPSLIQLTSSGSVVVLEQVLVLVREDALVEERPRRARSCRGRRRPGSSGRVRARAVQPVERVDRHHVAIEEVVHLRREEARRCTRPVRVVRVVEVRRRGRSRRA